MKNSSLAGQVLATRVVQSLFETGILTGIFDYVHNV